MARGRIWHNTNHFVMELAHYYPCHMSIKIKYGTHLFATKCSFHPLFKIKYNYKALSIDNSFLRRETLTQSESLAKVHGGTNMQLKMIPIGIAPPRPP